MFRGFEDLNSMVRPKMLTRGEPRMRRGRSKATVQHLTVFNLTQDKRRIDSDAIRPSTLPRAKASPGRRGHCGVVSGEELIERSGLVAFMAGRKKERA
jgi:hypothetical protein